MEESREVEEAVNVGEAESGGKGVGVESVDGENEVFCGEIEVYWGGEKGGEWWSFVKERGVDLRRGS